MLCIAYSIKLLGQAESSICYQLAEEYCEIDKIYESITTKRLIIPNNLLQYIDHMSILHLLLRLSTTAKEEQRTKLLVF
jgi:hypothetical protein